MTRKDYVLIAKVLKGNMDAWTELNPQFATAVERKRSREAVSFTAMDMADVLAQTNPRFERERFLKACGVPS